MGRSTLTTAIEVSKDGTRAVYHSYGGPNTNGWAWTHADTKKERAACSACTNGTLDSVRGAPR